MSTSLPHTTSQVAPAEATEPTPFRLSPTSREIRLGLVVYGGVSLAIYINGVTHELFRAVRGRGVYRLLKRLLNADIVTDIVSGTSAGGINGLLLAYALTNEREFSHCALLWREHGALAKLLRSIDDTAEATSLLDSRGYYIPRLEEALRDMPAVSAEERHKEAPSPFDELDLFVTGTDFDGRMTTTVDATGRQIEIKSHRTIFHLKHRRGRKMPFQVAATASSDGDRATISALAKLAAITSCFPAAFEPVRVAPSRDPHRNAVYELLREWGQLEGETWFIDGGVLDNKPFSYTIQQIWNRTATRPVERKLFYVEPDPERLDPARRRSPAQVPSVVQAAMDALLGIPGYESIAEDLEHIVRRNDKLQRQVRVREAAEAAFASAGAGADATDGQSLIPPSVLSIYQRVRFVQLSEQALKGLMEHEGFKRRIEPTPCPDTPQASDQLPRAEGCAELSERRRHAAAALARAFDQWHGAAAETLERFDVYFRIRRVFHVIYKLADKVTALCNTDGQDGRETEALRALTLRLQTSWQALNRQLATYNIARWAMERLLERQRLPLDIESDPKQAARLWLDLQTRFELLLAVDETELGLILARFERARQEPASTDYEEALKDLHSLLELRVMRIGAETLGPRPASGRARNLLQWLDAQTLALLESRHDVTAELESVRRAWQRFPLYDAHFFPIDYFADLSEKDPIDVVRISPMDATRAFSERSFEDKVTGETVMHFGAFLKRSWRSNDIMWGRLDGTCRILDALLTPEALLSALSRADVRQLLREDLDSNLLDPATLFPSSGTVIQGKLLGWLRGLASEDARRRAEAAADREMHTLLLWCAQLEVLDQDLPTVLSDAAVEQLQWNREIIMDGKGPSRVKRLESRVDLSCAVIAGSELTQQFIDRLKRDVGAFSDPKNAPVARHFLQKYRVGAENVRDDIPAAVILETLTQALIVARNCLLNAFPRYSTRITGSFIYKGLIHWPLMTAHTLAVFARREHPFYMGLLGSLLTYAFLALSVAALWPRVLYDQGQLSSAPLIGLVLVPLVIMVPILRGAWLWVTRAWRRSFVGALLLTLLSLLVLGAALIVVAAFVASWQTTHAVIARWVEQLASGADPELARSAARFALGFLLLFLLVLSPALRGWLESAVARRRMR